MNELILSNDATSLKKLVTKNDKSLYFNEKKWDDCSKFKHKTYDS